MRSQQHTCLQSHCQRSRSAGDVDTSSENRICIISSVNVSMCICGSPLVLKPTPAEEQLALKQGREAEATVLGGFFFFSFAKRTSTDWKHNQLWLHVQFHK